MSMELKTFADAVNDWAVRQKGTILHTTDDGENWSYQKKGEEIYTSIDLDENNVIYFGTEIIAVLSMLCI